MPGHVFVSVVIPTRGRPAYLRRALGGLVAQTERAWEAIVVDDGDGEGEEAAAALGDPRVRTTRNGGSGQVDARNEAIALARGEWIAWLDDDDWWEDPRHLALLRERAEADGRAWFHRGGWLVHEPDGRREPFDLDATAASMRRDNTVLTSSVAYPAALHDELGPLDPGVGSYWDWDFLLRACDAGAEPRRLPGLGVCYAVHGGNVSAEIASPERLRGFRAFAAKHGLDIVISNHVEIRRKLMSVPEGWSEEGEALEREFRFDDFRAAIDFVNRVAEVAEEANHHPDIEIHYNRVKLRWWTHTAGGVTERDRELAARVSTLA